VLHLVIHDPLGRASAVGFDTGVIDEHATFLSLTSRELEILSRFEDFDILDLWKFARDLHRYQEATHVMAFSTLDTFYVYSQHHRSFYLADDKPPTALNLGPGTSLSLRVKDVQRFDRHTVHSWLPHSFVEVVRRYPDTQFPVYITDAGDEPPKYVVEGLAFPIWVLPDNDTDEQGWDSVMFCEAIAYWMWQAIGAIRAMFSTAAPRDRLVLGVSVPARSADFDAANAGADWVGVEDVGDQIVVRFGAATSHAISGSNNAGERHLLELLLAALAREAGLQQPYDAAVVLEAVAPLGRKKMLIALDVINNPAMEENVPRSPRFVSEADESQLIDRMGLWLQGRAPAGAISSDDAGATLNGAVSFYFSELERLVHDLSPEGVLEHLIRHNEALIRAEAEQVLMLPTRIACFGAGEELVRELGQRIPALARAAIANRFLIEYVASQPPSGGRHLSLAIYDELLALASEIAQKGLLSDVLFFKLSDVRISLLPSGRMGLGGRDEMQAALNAYGPLQVQGALAGADVRFERNWAERSVEDPELLPDMEAAFVAEFGLSLSELATATNAIGDLARDQRGEPKSLPIEEVINGVAGALSCTGERAGGVVNSLTLGPRDPFLEPGRLPEVQPWRFNRSLSYLRRPLVSRTTADCTELLWGSRSLFRAGEYLMDLCFTGRIKARSPAMKAFISRMRHDVAEAFNDRVAATLDLPDTHVKRRVKKIGNSRIARDDGQDLGDVDVLVVNPRKRLITAVETKDVEIARIPPELANEIKRLLEGDDSAMHKHGDRVTWLRKHVPEILTWFGVPKTGRWRVQGLVVASRDLITPLAQDSPLPLVSYRALEVSPQRFV
jgi:hypothetical protein